MTADGPAAAPARKPRGVPGVPEPRQSREESTAAALAHLRDALRAHTARRRRSAAAALYGMAVVAAGLVVPHLVTAVGSARPGSALGAVAAHAPSVLPVAAPAALATAVFLAARGALWRGPVRVDLPTACWALPSPLLRRRLLLPRLAAATASGVLAGAVCGAVAGWLSSAGGDGSRTAAATAAGAWAGVVTALVAVAAGVLVQRHERVVEPVGWRAVRLGWTGVVLLAALTATAAVAGVPNWCGHVLLWSGPWGWAAQPLVAAVGGPAPGWLPASVAAAGAAAVATAAARRAAPSIPGESLRRRAAVGEQALASLFSLELRRLKELTRPGRPAVPRRLVRLPAPRRRWLVVPWRDATALLRAPGRPAWAGVWLAAATASAAAAPSLPPRPQAVLAAGALAAGYLAAAQLTESARLDGDDMRRSAGLPYPAGTLALLHAAVPAALLLAGTAAGALVCAAAGAWHPVLLLPPCAVPALVGAALVSSYRGAMPVHLAVGADTPFGNTAPLQMAVWYLRGPLSALALTVPALVLALGGDGPGPGHALWLLASGAVQLVWARAAARNA